MTATLFLVRLAAGEVAAAQRYAPACPADRLDRLRRLWLARLTARFLHPGDLQPRPVRGGVDFTADGEVVLRVVTRGRRVDVEACVAWAEAAEGDLERFVERVVPLGE